MPHPSDFLMASAEKLNVIQGEYTHGVVLKVVFFRSRNVLLDSGDLWDAQVVTIQTYLWRGTSRVQRKRVRGTIVKAKTLGRERSIPPKS